MKKKVIKKRKKCNHHFHFVKIFDNTYHIIFMRDEHGKEIQEDHIASFICDKCGFHKSIGVKLKEE